MLEIQGFYLPIIVTVLCFFLAWVFSGFKDGLEGIADNSASLFLSLIGVVALWFSIVFYAIHFLAWIYNNITIV